jgi:Mg-chelatase subunit ChlD
LKKTPQEELVSLSVYSTTAKKVLPLTNNLDAISSRFSQFAPNGFTAIGEGLKVGLDSVRNDPLARPFAEKTVVIMTDGNHNTGVSPDVIARTAGATTIHTITFGADANQNLMRTVAKIGGGTFLHANNNQELVAAFKEIALQLSVLLVE